MTAPLDVIDMPGPDEFVDRWLAPGRPVVVRGLSFDRQAWTAEGLRARAGGLATLVYGSLFDLEDIATLDDYLDDWFIGGDGPPGSPGPLEPGDEVPYVRWYNRLRDVEAAWGDEALARMADTWAAPACLPRNDLLLPVGSGDPVSDRFPYRGLLVAARGARTRLHRDPFGTDAVVAQFAGVKDAVLYEPDRAAELHLGDDTSSYGGFLDVRGDGRGGWRPSRTCRAWCIRATSSISPGVGCTTCSCWRTRCRSRGTSSTRQGAGSSPATSRRGPRPTASGRSCVGSGRGRLPRPGSGRAGGRAAAGAGAGWRPGQGAVTAAAKRRSTPSISARARAGSGERAT